MKLKQGKIKTSVKRRFAGIALFGVAGVFALTAVVVPTRVRADQFDEQIRALQQQNTQSRNSLQQLALEATSFQDAINRLNGQIAEFQAQIDANIAEQNRLTAEIEKGKQELAKQKALLAEDIKTMYVDGEPTTLEILASSSNLSDFVDKEEYRTAVQEKIQDTLKKVRELQRKLEQEKTKVDQLLKEQQDQQAKLAATRAEQNRMLTFNQQQQSDFNSQIKNNNAKITDLRRQQVLANLALFGGGLQPGIPGGGGYPWGNAYCVHTGQVGGDCYNYDWYFNGRAWDSWGYGFRNCTSWVAYKLAADGKAGFSNLGNANQWPGGARARGISVDYGSGARAGDAVVSASGFYGHIMYVEAVAGDGRIIVSDYNRAGDGLYRGPDGGNARVLDQSGLYFIHF